jgi:hypothetical protein
LETLSPACASIELYYFAKGHFIFQKTIPAKLTILPKLTGGFFLLGGVMLFFDRAMLAMGNVRLSL